MDFTDTPEEAAIRAEVRAWLDEHLTGDFAGLGGRGGPADETAWDVRVEWEKLLGKDRWLGISWPKEYGGRAASFAEQVVFNEEYAKANAPARISFFGEGLFAPTLLAFGTEEQKQRFLPKIQSVEELWCQGYSEPNAGSDLANVQTRGVLDGDQWVVNGQKVWTTLAHRAVVLLHHAHRPRVDRSPRTLVPLDPDGPARRRSSTAEADDRHGRVQRGLLLRRAPTRRTSSAR